MLSEIREIPQAARACYQRNQDIELPGGVPYLGMGSSFIATLVLKYLQKPVRPEMAAEYAYYLAKPQPEGSAVLISQSGYSSEIIWNVDFFESYTAIVNDTSSSLATARNASQVIDICAGKEKLCATKSYVNTLIALYQGHGIDTSGAIDTLTSSIARYEKWGKQAAQGIHARLSERSNQGVFVLGSGPNLGTAHQVALILTESTHLPVVSMSAAQYDHGPKEAAQNSIVLVINAEGKVYERTNRLIKKVTQAGAHCVVWNETQVPESHSPIVSIVPFLFLAYYLADDLGITEYFTLGGKITRVEE